MSRRRFEIWSLMLLWSLVLGTWSFITPPLPAAQIQLSLGSTNNDGTGDPLRTTFLKIQTNFNTLFNLSETNGLRQLGASNASVKPLLATNTLGTNTLYSVEAGTNVLLSMTATSVVFHVLSGTNVFVVDTAEEFTNVVKTAPRGSLVHTLPGRYHLLSVDLPLLTNDLHYHFEPGAVVVFGSSGDTAAGRIFSDIRSTSTNIISGQGQFIVSNKLSQFIGLSNAASRLKFEAYSISRFDNTENVSLILHDGGHMTVNIHGWMENVRYDGYWYNGLHGTDAFIHLTCPRISVGDTALEVNGVGVRLKPGNGNFYIGKMERHPSSTVGGTLLALLDECYVNAGGIVLRDRNISIGASLANHQPILECGFIVASNVTSEPIVVVGPALLRGPRIVGWTGVAPIAVDSIVDGARLVLDSCEIISSNTYSIASLDFDGLATNTIVSIGSYWNKPIGPRLRVEGSWSTTNSLDTTLTADNQVVPTAGAQYIKLSSDNVTAANRTFVLVTGTMGRGQTLTLEWTGTNAGELVDDAAMSGGGNVRLNGTWTPTQYDTLILRYNGTDLVEHARSPN